MLTSLALKLPYQGRLLFNLMNQYRTYKYCYRIMINLKQNKKVYRLYDTEVLPET